MVICDYVIRFDPSKDTQQDLVRRIIYSVIVKRRLKANKPCVVFIAGGSGEGKSISTLVLQQILLEVQGMDLKKLLNVINVYIPIQYPKKLNRLLYDKELKKVNILAMHEARDIIKAKMWYSFLTHSVADINAMSRSIKRLCIFIIAQSIRDITTDIRYTLNYYITVRRPAGRKARAYINVMWTDERDLEKPKLRKRKLMGYLVDTKGVYHAHRPKYLELSLPDKEIVDEFDRQDTEAKSAVVKRKLEKLLKMMEKDLGQDSKKIDDIIDWYAKNPQNLNLIGKSKGNKYKVSEDFKKMHDLTDTEAKDFETKIGQRLEQEGLAIIKREIEEHGE